VPVHMLTLGWTTSETPSDCEHGTARVSQAPVFLLLAGCLIMSTPSITW
jgi:hypothetical protein